MGSPVGEEDSIVGIDEGVMVIQSVLEFGVVLIVPMLAAEEVALEGMSVCVMCPSTGLKLVACVRTWVGVHQQLQWCVALFGNGYTESGGKLLDEGGLKDMWLIVKGEVQDVGEGVRVISRNRMVGGSGGSQDGR